MLPCWALALACVWPRFDACWIPYDEGTLAQPAERVLMGELPHRDFDEVYTGGLDWLNALAFRVFGMNLRSMRIPLFLLFSLWVPALFWIATRFVGALTAVPFLALCVIWSLPRYGAPMPSWYILFLATFGTAALLRHLETGGRTWLVMAGACGGLAVLAKITGLHFVAGALLFMAWREPGLSARAATTGREPGLIYPIALSAGLALFVLVLLKQVWPLAVRYGFGPEIEHFVLPGALVALIVSHRAWTGSRAPSGIRFRTLLGLALPFLTGFAIPVAIFVAPYVASGAVASLVEGVLILPAKRLSLQTTVSVPPDVWSAVYLVPLVAIAMIPRPRGRRWPAIALLLAIALLTAAVWIAAKSETGVPEDIFRAMQVSIRHLLPATAVLGAWQLWRLRMLPATAAADRLALVLAVGALVSLVQFPFSAQIYFFYAAPLIVIAAVAVLATPGLTLRDRPGLVVVVAFLIASMLVIPTDPAGRAHPGPLERLATPRCGLRLPVADVQEYDGMLALLRDHARGPFVWGGPDAPEVAFLAGLRNPTRTIFDCFDGDFDAGDHARTARLFTALDEHGVTAVAVNGWASFSGLPPQELAAGINARFPRSETAGRFWVAWKE